MQVRVIAEVVSIMVSPLLDIQGQSLQGRSSRLSPPVEKKRLMNWVILLKQRRQCFISVLFSPSTARLKQQEAFSLLTAPYRFLAK